MAKAKKLPSGSWRVRVTYTDESGVKHQASFTDDNPKIAEAKAAMWQAGMLEKDEQHKQLPLGMAIDEYIDTCRAVGMSPATIRAHVASRKSAFPLLIEKSIYKLTVRDIQRQIDERAKEVSPKTLRNNLGLLSVVLKQNEVDLNLSALRLPQREIEEPEVPSDQQVTAMLDDLRSRKDDDMYIAVMLAALLGLRRSEICALTWSDIQTKTDGDETLYFLSVDKALVRDENNLHVEKGTKTRAGKRLIQMPETVHDELMARRSLRTNLVGLTPGSISERYRRLAEKHGLGSKRFHVLRHYMASVMDREKVSPTYAAKVLGHASAVTTQRVYTHAMSEGMKAVGSVIDLHAASVLKK